jgi:protein XagA
MRINLAIRKHPILAAILLAMILPAPALEAGAWIQNPGHGQFIVTTSFFQVTRGWDQGGATRTFANGGKFKQFEVNPYLELGVFRRNTLVINAFLPVLRYQDSYGTRSSFGFGNVEVGWRRRLNSPESRWAVSGQATVALPAYSDNRNPPPGNHQQDVEGRFSVGYGQDYGASHLFWDVEAGYRYRAGAPADQVRSEVTGGVELARRVMFIGQFFGITGMRNGQPISELLNPYAQSDFDLYKVQGSIVARLPAKMRLQAGINQGVVGRNTGRATGFLVAIWCTF